MLDPDMAALAQKIVELEKRHKALARSQQLPQSSVRTTDGEDVLLSNGLEDGLGASSDVEAVIENAADLTEIVDTNIQDIDFVPDWIEDSSSIGDNAWEAATDAGVAAQEALDEANQAAADALAAAQAGMDAQTAAEAAAVLAGTAQGTADTARDEAEAKADAARLAAIAAAAADATAKADAAQAAAEAKAQTAQTAAAKAQAEAASKGQVWSQDTAPPAGRSYAWLGAVNASASVEMLDGVEVRRNLIPDPRFTKVDSGAGEQWVNTRLEDISVTDGVVEATVWAIGDMPRLTSSVIGAMPVSPGDIVTLSATKALDDGVPHRARVYFFSGNLPVGAAIQGTTVSSTDEPFYITTTVPEGVDFVRAYLGGNSNLPVGTKVSFKEPVLEKTPSLGAPFDGSTPSDRSHDLWINTTNGDNTPNRWGNTGWEVVTDKAATDAAAAAVTAQGAASAAATVASSAQSTADTAQTAASTAQTTADGKGKTIIQATAPAVADRLPQNLWIDTTGGANTPKRWTGTAWVTITDKTATDAANAAVQAHDAAVAAQTAADTAQTSATAAQTSANKAQATADGRNRIFAGATAPTSDPANPFVGGDLWYETAEVEGKTVFDSVNMWNGTTWKPYQLVADSLLVPSSVGAILLKDGAITGPKISADAIDGKVIRGAQIIGGYFELDTLSNLEVKYTNNASLITGWTVPNYSNNTYSGVPATLNTSIFKSPPSSVRSGTTVPGSSSGGLYLDIPPTDLSLAGSLKIQARLVGTASDFPMNGLGITFYDTVTNAEAHYSTSVFVTGGEWSEHTIYFEMGSDFNAVNRLYFYGTSDGNFYLDDLEITTGQTNEDRVTISRRSDGAAAISSINDSSGESVIVSKGGLVIDYSSAFGGHTSRYNNTGVTTTSEGGGATVYNITTQTGRGDSINLYSQNIDVRGSGIVDITSGNQARLLGPRTHIATPIITSSRPSEILWSGALYMQEGQTANLTRNINSQLTGIVLVFAPYSGGQPQINNINYEFIPKNHIAERSGTGVNLNLKASDTLVRKYLYINNTAVVGNNLNITAPNNLMVLIRVLGV